MQRVKVFDFDMESKTTEDVETTINEFIDTLMQKDPKLDYKIISSTYLKFWRIIIYF